MLVPLETLDVRPPIHFDPDFRHVLGLPPLPEVKPQQRKAPVIPAALSQALAGAI